MNWSAIRGFNYQPSWGSAGLEIWRNFDAERMGHELALGRAYFPGINAIRLWLSHEAWARDPKKFAANLETALGMAACHGLRVMPCLFNRWHDPILDYGGIYADHFLPKSSWLLGRETIYDFVRAIATTHAADERIFTWDLCNEPFAYHGEPSDVPALFQAESNWLKRVYGILKDCGVQAPITVGIHPGYGLELIRKVEPISDVLSIHPYWMGESTRRKKADYEKQLDDYVAFAESAGKPLLATECCWGSTDDADRVEMMKFSLEQLKKRGIGWLAYLLHHSLIADAHRVEFGPIGAPGNLSFIEADGRLRPGHEAFNNY